MYYSSHLIILTFALISPTSTLECFDHVLFQPGKLLPVDCPVGLKNSVVSMAQTSSQTTEKWRVDLRCTADGDTCRKVEDGFMRAGEYLKNVIDFIQPITVDARFIDLCSELGQCTNDPSVTILGSAAPARSLLLEDDDGVQRLYPQSLVKQLPLPSQPTFSRYDIIAAFNQDANWHFEDDGPIQADQSDFLFVICHELAHGLGFASAWGDYVNDARISGLTPLPLSPNQSSFGSLVFRGFYENAFDRYIIETNSGQKLTELKLQLDDFAGQPPQTFNSAEQFVDALFSSDQWSIAEQVLDLATTPRSLAFLTSDNERIILETSLKPYQEGSSVSHVDQEIYGRSADFLMQFVQRRGISLQDYIEETGNFPGGPYGPLLLSTFQTLGYSIQLEGFNQTVGSRSPRLPNSSHPISLSLFSIISFAFSILFLHIIL